VIIRKVMSGIFMALSHGKFGKFAKSGEALLAENGSLIVSNMLVVIRTTFYDRSRCALIRPMMNDE